MQIDKFSLVLKYVVIVEAIWIKIYFILEASLFYIVILNTIGT